MLMRLFFTLIILAMNTTSFADTNVKTYTAISFLGDPKYKNEFNHLEYANPDAPKGGLLKRSVIGTFDSLNPFIVKGTTAAGVKAYVYDQLMSRVWDEPFSLYSNIAESISIPDSLEWVSFKIRKNAKFHDGHPITADDVLFSAKTFIEKGKPRFKRAYAIDRMEKLNEYEVKFYLDPKKANRETPMVIAMMSVLPEHFYEGKEFEKANLDIPLGSGPYKITDVSPGQSISFERVKDYWGADLPQHKGFYNFDKMKFEYFRDNNVEFEAFKAGSIDIRRESNAKRWAKEHSFKAVKKDEIAVEEISEGFPSGMRSFVFNTRRPLFQDREVRKALSLVFDFEWVNKNLFYGLYTRTNSVFAKSPMDSSLALPNQEELNYLEAYKDQLPEEVFTKTFTLPKTDGSGRIRENLREARSLLEKAGWIVENNILKNKETGEVFAFEILLSDPNYEKIALNYINNLKKLGAQVKLRTVDSSQYQQRLETYDFDMMLYRWIVTLSPGVEQRLYWGSQSADREGTRNYAGIKNPVVDSMIEKLINAESVERQMNIVRAMDRVLMWGHYFVPLYHKQNAWVAYSSKLKRPSYIPVYGFVLETWWDKSFE